MSNHNTQNSALVIGSNRSNFRVTEGIAIKKAIQDANEMPDAIAEVDDQPVVLYALFKMWFEVAYSDENAELKEIFDCSSNIGMVHDVWCSAKRIGNECLV